MRILTAELLLSPSLNPRPCCGGTSHSTTDRVAGGDDVILTDERYFLPFMARAMTYVDCNILSRETLQTIISNFPISKRKIRRSSLLLALRRHMMWNAKETKLVMLTAQAAAIKSDGKGDFLDRIHTASSTVSEAQAQSVQMAVTLEKDLLRRAGKITASGEGSAEQGGSPRHGGLTEVAPAGFHKEMMDGMRSMHTAINDLQGQMRQLTAQTSELQTQMDAALEAGRRLITG